MASLGGPLAFPLGGGGLTGGKPWLVNMRPAPEEDNVRLLRPISFSIRDTETYVDPATLNISTGYSRIYGRGNKFFDEDIPRTIRRGFTVPLTNLEPAVSLIPNPSPNESVRIKKFSNSVERSVYYTFAEVDNVRAFRNVMVSGLIKPIVLTDENGSLPLGYTGALLGIELGPRNTAAYVFFKIVDGIRQVFLTGPFIPSQLAAPAVITTYDWSVNQRYSLIWNESRGLVQLFANNNELVCSNLITDFPQFTANSPKHAPSNEYAMVYGIEGLLNEEVEISAISFTDDIGFPIINTAKPNAYRSFFRPADLVRTTPGVDPRKDPISPWYDDDLHFGAIDPNGTARIFDRSFQLAKVTPSPISSLAIYREEPGFLLGNAAGYSVDINFVATCTKFDGDATGMGFVISDAFTAFRVGCFQKDGIRYIGILKVGGDETVLADQVSVAYDWTVPGILRFVLDGRKTKLRFYDHENLSIPILDLDLVRNDYPVPGTYIWDSLTPFIAVGHYANTQTAGSIYLKDIVYSHLYESWDVFDQKHPDNVTLSQAWTKTSNGTPFISSEPLLNDYQLIDCGSGDSVTYLRSANTNVLRGGTVEFQVSIDENDKYERTGDSVILDDGLHAFIVSFAESEEGRFVCFSVRDGLGSYTEVIGFDGNGKELSTAIDWTKPHIYRIERKPGEGTFLFINDEIRPRIVLPDSRLSEIPGTIHGGPAISFGHFKISSPSIAKWYFVRAFWSTGFEVAFKTNKPDLELKDRLFATESIVLVEVEDVDPPPPPPPLCIGGYPGIVQWLVGGLAFSGNTSELAVFTWGGSWDFSEFAGTTIKFHLSMFRDGSITGNVQFKVYSDPITFGGLPTNLIWSSGPLSSNGFIYAVSGSIAKPSGQKNIVITTQGTVPSGTVSLYSVVLVVEFE